MSRSSATRRGQGRLLAPRLLRAEDRALLAAGRGDARAFTRLYDRLAPAAISVATVVTGDARCARLAVTEAFVELWREAATFDVRRASARTWLLSLVQQRAARLGPPC